MATNTIKTRIQHKNDSTSNWSQATTFIPLKGELIIYNDATTPKIKIGDGTTLVSNLPFVADALTTEKVNEQIQTYVDEAILGGEW